MNIVNIRIRNFRGLEHIEFSPKSGVNVLVGPNAVGKTSVLEAMRLTKALLAPRYREEVSQVLVSLGAATQHMLFAEGQIDFAALAGVPTSPLEIALDISLSPQEILNLAASTLGLSQALVRSRLGQERAASQLDLIQYMSSPQGQAQLQIAQKDVQTYLDSIQIAKKVTLVLSMQLHGNNLQINSKDTNAQLIVQALEGSCPPASALVTYFPADRALPSGEINIQLGSADMQQQVFSHLAQPATKYSRLKQIIVNSFLLGATAKSNLEESFNAIFGQLLPGKKLEAIQQKPTGNLSVLIKDIKSGRVFDIDNMSSGEKGLILTFLLLKSGAAPGGLVFLDEPELHLNPAVCSRLVPFLHTEIISPLNLQLFVCTHSAEILSSALQRDDCSVFHLRTPRDATPVDRRDKAELFEILRRLGLSSMDVVSWQGTIFVEGEDDIELLSLGFPELLSNYQLKQLGGRGEVEKDILRLQSAESKGDIQRLNVFIFDHDSMPSLLKSSNFVRTLQWDRYSIESYLLDENLLFDVVNRHAETKVESKGALRTLLRELALKQVTDVAVRRVYTGLEPENCGLRPKEVIGKSSAQCAEILFERIERLRGMLEPLSRAAWTESFVSACSQEEQRLREDWDTNWRKRCNAKRLLRELQAQLRVCVSVGFLKSEMIKEMRFAKSEDWRVMESMLVQSIKV
jgi:predicted ATPase